MMRDDEFTPDELAEFYGIPLLPAEQAAVQRQATNLLRHHRDTVRIGRQLLGRFTDDEAIEPTLGGDDCVGKDVMTRLANGSLSDEDGRALVARFEDLTGLSFRALHSEELLLELAARRVYRRRLLVSPTPRENLLARIRHWCRRVRRDWRRLRTPRTPQQQKDLPRCE